ncbi:AzlC family ABC transporter permease [Paenibacillus tarimensis]
MELERAESITATAVAAFWKGVRDCIPTLLGYLSLGFATGVVGKTAGLSTGEIVLMSVFLYAGSAQFIVAGMVAASTPAVSIIVTVFFVNIRHLLLSAALAPFFRKYSPWTNMLIGSQLTDETFGVAINRLTAHMKHSDKWMFGMNITAHLNWVAANLAGALFGAAIPDPDKYGLSYALPAMFVGLLVLQVADRKQWKADASIIISAIFIFIMAFLFVPGSIAVMFAATSAACIGVVAEKWK